MSLCVLSLLLACVSLGSSDPLCEGSNCPPTLAPLIPATSVLPPTPGSLIPATTPAKHTRHTPTPTKHTTHTPTPTKHTTHTPTPTKHTTHTPKPSNHTTHTPKPANHTTHTLKPANHTTHTTPANHTSPANHTTPIPTNHTTHPVPPPTGPPVLKEGTYKVTNKKMICALAKLKIELRVEYKAGRWGTFFIQPNQTNASGVCEESRVNMTLSFPQGFLTFGFQKDKKGKNYHLHQIKTQLTYEFPGTGTPTKFVANNAALVVMETALGHCSRCSNLSLEAGRTFWVDLVDQEVQVFEVPSSEAFGPADVCPQDHKLPVVAIVVVVLLLLLVIIIIIIYLVRRKQNPAGYQSL